MRMIECSRGDGPPSRRWILLLAASAPWVLATGCASLAGPRTITVTQEQLLAGLMKRLPLAPVVAELFQVVVATPRLKMLPQSNRIATELDLGLTERLLGRSFKATLGASFGLRLDTSDRTVRLDDLRIDRMAVPGLTGDLADMLGRVASVVTQSVLQDAVLYTLKPEDLAVAGGLGYAPGSLKVEPGGLSLTLVPR